MEIGWKGYKVWAAAAWFIPFRILRDHPECTMQWWQNRHLSEVNKLASVGPNMSLVNVLRDLAPSLRVLTTSFAQSYLYYSYQSKRINCCKEFRLASCICWTKVVKHKLLLTCPSVPAWVHKHHWFLNQMYSFLKSPRMEYAPVQGLNASMGSFFFPLQHRGNPH